MDSVKSKLAADRVDDGNSRRSAHNIAKGEDKVKGGVEKVLMAVLGQTADRTKEKIAIIGLDRNEALKRLSTHIKMELQTAISRIRSNFYLGDSEALQNVAVCRAVLQSLMAEVRRNRPETADTVISFNEVIAVVESEQT